MRAHFAPRTRVECRLHSSHFGDEARWGTVIEDAVPGYSTWVKFRYAQRSRNPTLLIVNCYIRELSILELVAEAARD